MYMTNVDEKKKAGQAELQNFKINE